MKKILSLLLAAILILPIGGMAAFGTSAGEVSVTSASGRAGDTVVVPVQLCVNPGIIALFITMQHDPDLTLTKVVNGSALSNGFTMTPCGDSESNPYNVHWYAPTLQESCTETGTLVEFTFQIAEDAQPGEKPILLTYSRNNTFDVDLQEVPFTVQSGCVTVSDTADTSCLVTLDPNGGMCGMPAVTAFCDEPYGVLPVPTREGFTFDGWFAPDGTLVTESTVCRTSDDHTLTAHWTAIGIVVKENSGAVIDRVRGVICGLEFGLRETSLRERFLSASDGGRLEIRSQTGLIGTGTVVRLIEDRTGKELESFTIVIFGDVTGDGQLNSSDVTAVRSISVRLIDYPPDSPFFLASDVNHDGKVNSTDVTAIRAAGAKLLDVPQTV